MSSTLDGSASRRLRRWCLAALREPWKRLDPPEIHMDVLGGSAMKPLESVLLGVRALDAAGRIRDSQRSPRVVALAIHLSRLPRGSRFTSGLLRSLKLSYTTPELIVLDPRKDHEYLRFVAKGKQLLWDMRPADRRQAYVTAWTYKQGSQAYRVRHLWLLSVSGATGSRPAARRRVLPSAGNGRDSR